MPKQRQIPRLFPQPLANGTTVWHWKPSASLRKAGWTNRKLGTNERAAINQALDLNEQVRQWQAGATGSDTAAPARRVPRVVRFAELVQRYRESTDFTGNAPATRHNYETRLNQLAHWAMDGELPVAQIDRQMVIDLKKGLQASGSDFVTAATLRVLRLLLQWACDNNILTANPASAIKIPETKPRKVQMSHDVREAIAEAAIELEDGVVAFGIQIGFWLLQRRADVLQLNRFALKAATGGGIDPRHRAALADERGRVMAFRLCQQKTGTWIDAPIPPHILSETRERLRESNGGWLFQHPDDPDRPMPGKVFQNRFRAARDAAVAVAIIRGDEELAERIDEVQFRDLRRTGMVFYRDAGASVPNITALSGHYVLGKKTIMDVYMPGDTAGAVACVSTGYSAWLRQQEEIAEAEA